VVEDYALTVTRVPHILDKLRWDSFCLETLESTNPLVRVMNATTMSTFPTTLRTTQ
jgi:hypothetical protein